VKWLENDGDRPPLQPKTTFAKSQIKFGHKILMWTASMGELALIAPVWLVSGRAKIGLAFGKNATDGTGRLVQAKRQNFT
jgi:hypothetical protein